MPTKAQEFRTEQQRNAKPPMAPKPPKKAPRRERTAPVVGRPARKSTHATADHTKATTNQQLEAVRKATTPTANAIRAIAARPVRGRGGNGGKSGAGRR
jgi:hypothetical protein